MRRVPCRSASPVCRALDMFTTVHHGKKGMTAWSIYRRQHESVERPGLPRGGRILLVRIKDKAGGMMGGRAES